MLQTLKLKSKNWKNEEKQNLVGSTVLLDLIEIIVTNLLYCLDEVEVFFSQSSWQHHIGNWKKMSKRMGRRWERSVIDDHLSFSYTHNLPLSLFHTISLSLSLSLSLLHTHSLTHTHTLSLLLTLIFLHTSYYLSPILPLFLHDKDSVS